MENKIRWSVASAMATVCDSLNNSKLELNQNTKCKLAVQRLCQLYTLSELQAWILRVVCKNYIDNKKDTTTKGLAKFFGVPASLAKGWKNDIETLRANGFLSFARRINFAIRFLQTQCMSLRKNKSLAALAFRTPFT